MSQPMLRRWEYKTVWPPHDEIKKEAEDPETALNVCGDDGWELVATIEYTGGGTKYLAFKRPVEMTSPTDKE